MLRDLQSNLLNRLIVVPGIITSASKSQIKASTITFKCKNCGFQKVKQVNPGLGGVSSERRCEREQTEKCPLDPYIIVPEECIYKDHQTLKIQEAPELVPTGEMPRSYVVTVDRCLVDKVTPGTRVTIVGVFSIISRQDSLKSGSSE